MRFKLKKGPLKEWKRREGRSFRWLAQKIGIGATVLADQMSGRCGVSLATALALETELGLPVRDLVEPI